mgnify:CR=1 FL=1
MNQTQSQQFGLLQVGIILLALATAMMHFLLIFPDVLFILNALGYVALLAALYLPIPFLVGYRRWSRWALLGYTALTVVLWAAIGQRDLYAYTNKLIELVLIVLLWLEGRQAR